MPLTDTTRHEILARGLKFDSAAKLEAYGTLLEQAELIGELVSYRATLNTVERGGAYGGITGKQIRESADAIREALRILEAKS